MKILILSCSTGEGHNSASKAVGAYLQQSGIDYEIKDVLDFKSNKASRKVSDLYSTVIRKFPAVFGIVYTLGGIYDKSNLPSPIYGANAKYADKLYLYIKNNGYDCVICAHLFAMEAVSAVKNVYGLQVRCFGLLTDYTTVPFYKDTCLDGYFVPNEKVKEQLNEAGIPTEKIYCTGIPVHPKFRAAVTKIQARDKLGIPRDKKVLAVMFGGAGCDKVVKLCDKLDKALDGNYRVLTFPARNEKLKKALEEKFKANEKFSIVPFTDDINLYLKAADAVITKPGGLSSTEIAVLNIPIVHIRTIPGLETANVKYFSGNGLSVRARSLKSAVKAAVTLLSNGELAENMISNQKATIRADSTEFIAKIITETVRNDKIFMATVYNGRLYIGKRDVLQDYPEAANA